MLGAGNGSVVAVALALMGCGLTGCGAPKAETIEVIAFWSGEEQDAFTEVFTLFERQTGVDVRYVPAGDELATILQTRIAGGNAPNVAIAPQPGLVYHLAATGALVPLPEEIVTEVKNNYHDVWTDLGTVKGTLYAVPFKATHKSTIWYNQDTLRRYGQPPQTWEELLDLCRRLADSGIAPMSVGGADGWVLTDWFENVYLQQSGTAKYHQLTRREIPWTDPSVRAALETLRQLLGQDRFVSRGKGGALQTEFAQSVLAVFGPQASAAMVYEGDFVAAVIRKDTAATVGQTARFFPFPGPVAESRRIVVGGDQAVAFRSDPTTMRFLRFLASAQAGEVWARRGGFLSPNGTVALDSYPDQISKELARQLVDKKLDMVFDMSDLYPAEFGATRGAGEWKALQDFLSNPQDIDAVMRQLDAAATAVATG